MKKEIFKFLLLSLIICIPIIVSMIVESISKVITMEHIITVVYILIPITIITLIKMEIQDFKEKE